MPCYYCVTSPIDLMWVGCKLKLILQTILHMVPIASLEVWRINNKERAALKLKSIKNDREFNELQYSQRQCHAMLIERPSTWAITSLASDLPQEFRAKRLYMCALAASEVIIYTTVGVFRRSCSFSMENEKNRPSSLKPQMQHSFFFLCRKWLAWNVRFVFLDSYLTISISFWWPIVATHTYPKNTSKKIWRHNHNATAKTKKNQRTPSKK